MSTPQTPPPAAQVPAWRLRARQVTQEPVDVAQADPGQGAKGVGVDPPWAVDPMPQRVKGSRTARLPLARSRDSLVGAAHPGGAIPQSHMGAPAPGVSGPQAGGPIPHAKEMGTSVQDVHTAEPSAPAGPTSAPLERPAAAPLGAKAPAPVAEVAQPTGHTWHTAPELGAPVADPPADPAPGETLARTVTYETAGAPWNGGGSGTLGTPPARPMPNTPREVRTQRVRQCMALMASGRWERGVTNEELAVEWGLEPNTVTQIATQASRVLECIDLPGGNIRGALLAQVTVLQDAVMACVVGPDGKGPDPERAAQLFTAAKGVLELHMKAWGMLTGAGAERMPTLPTATGEGTARGATQGSVPPPVAPVIEPPSSAVGTLTTGQGAAAGGAADAKRLSAKDMRARLLDAVAELDAEIARAEEPDRRDGGVIEPPAQGAPTEGPGPK